MEYLGNGNRISCRTKLLALILSHGYKNGWITKIQKLKVEAEATFKNQQFELFKLMKNMKSDDNAVKIFWAIRCLKEMELVLNETGWDENHFLQIITTKLLEKGLITEGEKLEFDLQLQRKTEEVEKNPLLIGPVIRCTLRHLNLEDIMTCRLICKEWNAIAMPIFKNTATINLWKTDDKNADKWTLDSFYDIFAHNEETISFNAFRVRSDHKCPWTVGELNAFFDRHQKYIRKLKLENVELVDRAGNWIVCFDISQWITKSPIAKPENQLFTKLEIEYDAPSCLINVQISALRGVKSLKLTNCSITLTEDIKIQPRELELADVAFFRDGNKLSQLCINEVFDLSVIEKINLEYDYRNVKSTALELNLSGAVHLEHFEAPHIQMLNWKRCKWTVNKFDMSERPFIEETNMEIKDLKLWKSNVDLSVLPQSIENLSIQHIKTETVFASSSVRLQNLRFLDLHFREDCNIPTISHFRDCPKLTSMEMENREDIQFTINLNCIPKSVKRLKLCGFKVRGSKGPRKLNVDKLVLEDYSFYEIRDMGRTYIGARELVLEFPYGTLADEQLCQFLEHGSAFSEFFHRIFAVGRIDWQFEGIDTFGKNPLREYVDKKSAYYIFENKTGKTITYSEFEKLKNIKPDQ